MLFLESSYILVDAQCHLASLAVYLDLSLLLTIHKVPILAVQFCCGRVEYRKMLTNIDAPHRIINIGV